MNFAPIQNLIHRSGRSNGLQMANVRVPIGKRHTQFAEITHWPTSLASFRLSSMIFDERSTQ